MICEDCPARDACGGDMTELVVRLLREHEGLLGIFTSMPRAEGVLAAFVMGYLLGGTTEDVPLDMEVWGDCLGGNV